MSSTLIATPEAPPAPTPTAAPSMARLLLDGPGWILLRVGLDFGALTAAVLLWSTGPGAPGLDARWPLLLLVPVTMALIASMGLYARRVRVRLLDGVVPLVRAVLSGTATAGLACLYLTSPLSFVTLVGVGVTALGLDATVRVSAVALQRLARLRGDVGRPTLIVGSGVIADRIARRLLSDPAAGLVPVGFVDQQSSRTGPELCLPVLGTQRDLDALVAEHGVRHLVLAFPSTGDRMSVAIANRAHELGLDISVVPRLFDVMNERTVYETIAGLPLFGLRVALSRRRSFWVKHTLDRAGAALGLLVLAVPMAIIAAAVKLSSPGPILFRQSRAGRDGVPFDLLKFRSMRIDADPEAPLDLPPGVAPGGVEGVDRRTRVGRIIRRTSLDELPQLVNVLRGEMSLVGPRPERPELVQRYTTELDRYFDRHRVRAGITGLAQVSGLRGQTSLIERIELDNSYIQHWSLSLDVKILLLTFAALFRHAE